MTHESNEQYDQVMDFVDVYRMRISSLALSYVQPVLTFSEIFRRPVETPCWVSVPGLNIESPKCLTLRTPGTPGVLPCPDPDYPDPNPVGCVVGTFSIRSHACTKRSR